MEFKTNEAIYIQIANFICDGILTGKWRSDDRIASVRELAVDLQVNPNTAMRSYEYLQNKEIIYNKRGIGFFVSADAESKIIAERRQTFLKDDLPSLFRTLDLLNISVEEMLNEYQKFKQDENEGK